jgi:CHAT domain-containing protein
MAVVAALVILLGLHSEHALSRLPVASPQNGGLSFLEVPSSRIAQTKIAQTDAGQLTQQGREAYQAGQLTQAVLLWQQAAAVYQALGDRSNQALALSYLSLAHQQLGNWRDAEQAIAQSLALLSSSTAPAFRAQAFNTQGSLRFAQGQPADALLSWQQAAVLYAQVGNQTRKTGSLINQAQAQQALGLFLQAKQTLTQVEQALNQQPDSSLKALGLRSLGNLWMLMDNRTQAERVLQQSLAIATQLALPADQQATQISLGNVARSQKDFNTASRFYQQAAAMSASPLYQAQSQINQFSLLLESNRIPEAEALLPTVQTQLAQLPPSQASIYAHINLAQSLTQWETHQKSNKTNPSQPTTPPTLTSNLKLAAQLLSTGIQQANALSDPEQINFTARRAEAYALGYLGGVYEQTQQWDHAQQLTEKALVLSRSLNAPEITYQWQWQLGRLLKAQGKRDLALSTYRAAYETLNSIRNTLLIASNSDRQFSFRENVEPVYREYVSLLLQADQAENSQVNLQTARTVIESLQLAELDNFFRTACLDAQKVAIDGINQTNAAVFYPIILPDRIEVILSVPGQPLRHFGAPVPQADVETVISQFQRSLLLPITTPKSRQLGQQIYSWLINPDVESTLKTQSIQTLVFVLDGSLRNIPIAALYTGQQYLIERYSIALAPGLQLINPKPLQQRGLQTLAAGLSQGRHGFSDLPNVETELKQIQSTVSSKVLLNQAFQSATLQDQINATSFPIVHLATHGQFSSNADKTFILAWDKPIPVTELGALLRRREETQEAAIELLILSACQTATGDKRAALGLAGVAVQAGARSTLASLWSLDDVSASQFMTQFYRQLATQKGSKAEAVRQAQLTLLKDPDFRHPRYCAPYVLIGNWL